MKSKELLKIAREKYPIGTVVVPINKDYMMGQPPNVTVEIDDHHLGYYEDWCAKRKDAIWVDAGDWCAVVYSRGVWAEIINK